MKGLLPGVASGGNFIGSRGPLDGDGAREFRVLLDEGSSRRGSVSSTFGMIFEELAIVSSLGREVVGSEGMGMCSRVWRGLRSPFEMAMGAGLRIGLASSKEEREEKLSLRVCRWPLGRVGRVEFEVFGPVAPVVPEMARDEVGRSSGNEGVSPRCSFESTIRSVSFLPRGVLFTPTRELALLSARLLIDSTRTFPSIIFAEGGG